jgi:putative FmdB family regulatory protein
MPVYTYRCDNCGVQFERRQSFNDRHLVRCPECGKNALHRVYLPVGVVFKGSGFYVTDNRSSSSASLPSKNKSGESESKTAESESKTESGKEGDSKKSASKKTESSPASKE